MTDVAASRPSYLELLGFASTNADGTGAYAERQGKREPRVGPFDARWMGEAIGLPGRAPSAPAHVGRYARIFEVADIDVTHRRPRTRGARILQPPTHRPEGGLRTVHVRDPHGNDVEFSSRRR